MTDRERLLALLEDFGVQPDQNEIGETPDSVLLTAHVGNVTGYGGFVCEFQFTPEGEFLEVSVWE